MKRETKILLGKAIDSLVLSIEHFNRPWDKGREEAVLILMDRSFELLLKAIIVHRNGKIREARAKETIGFDKCVRKCVSDPVLNCLTEQQAFTIQIINSLRDAAQHYILDISEQQLYIYSQAGATLFNQLLADVFGKKLSTYIPERVLPISTSPPRDFISVIDTEFSEIKKLLRPKSRKRLEARAKIRSLAIVESSLKGVRTQPSKPELEGVARQIEKGKNWRDIFPGVASLSLDSSGEGPSISIRLTKKEGEAVHLVPEGTPGATVMAVKPVNELGYYCLGLYQLADKLEITPPKLLAVIRKIGLQDDREYFKKFKIGATEYKRYSAKAVLHLKNTLPSLDIDQIWEEDKALKKKMKK